MVKHYQKARSNGTTNNSNGNSHNKQKGAKIKTSLEKLEVAKCNGKSNHSIDCIASLGSVSLGNNSKSHGTQCGSHNGFKSQCEHSGKFHCGQCWYAPKGGNSSALDDNASKVKPKASQYKVGQTKKIPLESS